MPPLSTFTACSMRLEFEMESLPAFHEKDEDEAVDEYKDEDQDQVQDDIDQNHEDEVENKNQDEEDEDEEMRMRTHDINDLLKGETESEIYCFTVVEHRPLQAANDVTYNFVHCVHCHHY